MEHTITLKKLCSVNLHYSAMILNFKFRVFSQYNEVLRLDFGKNNKAAQKGPGSYGKGLFLSCVKEMSVQKCHTPKQYNYIFKSELVPMVNDLMDNEKVAQD